MIGARVARQARRRTRRTRTSRRRVFEAEGGVPDAPARWVSAPAPARWFDRSPRARCEVKAALPAHTSPRHAAPPRSSCPSSVSCSGIGRAREPRGHAGELPDDREADPLRDHQVQVRALVIGRDREMGRVRANFLVFQVREGDRRWTGAVAALAHEGIRRVTGALVGLVDPLVDLSRPGLVLHLLLAPVRSWHGLDDPQPRHPGALTGERRERDRRPVAVGGGQEVQDVVTEEIARHPRARTPPGPGAGR